MELTFADLQKMALTKMKELALTIDGIHGVHSMKKAALLEAICEAKGIVDTSKVEAEKRRKAAASERQKIKIQAQKLRVEREQKKSELSRKEKDVLRKNIKQLKRKTRKLTKV